MKHTPQRMCIACRTMYAQDTLIRIVNENGAAVLDMEKKRFGRGAYICKNPDCIKKARKKQMIERHLKCPASSELYDCCAELAEGLPKRRKGDV